MELNSCPPKLSLSTIITRNNPSIHHFPQQSLRHRDVTPDLAKRNTERSVLRGPGHFSLSDLHDRSETRRSGMKTGISETAFGIVMAYLGFVCIPFDARDMSLRVAVRVRWGF